MKDYTGAPTSFASCLAEIITRSRKTMNELFYGFTAYELEVELKKQKGDLNNLLMVMLFGELLGLPMFPPYYSLRLLPFVVPNIGVWKRNIQREKDLTDFMGSHM
ncbi:MAG TPA: hypothetical protein VLZ07_05205 [Syntrophales bacterium]|nr:hypothetical protein [Syntrophales bacterium]